MTAYTANVRGFFEKAEQRIDLFIVSQVGRQHKPKPYILAPTSWAAMILMLVVPWGMLISWTSRPKSRADTTPWYRVVNANITRAYTQTEA